MPKTEPCVCVCAMTGVALTGPICHPWDLWWIDKEKKHRHKRLKMNSCRLKATFSVERNAELQHDITGSGSLEVSGEPNPSFSIQHLRHILRCWRTSQETARRVQDIEGGWDEAKASSEPEGLREQLQDSGSAVNPHWGVMGWLTKPWWSAHWKTQWSQVWNRPLGPHS